MNILIIFLVIIILCIISLFLLNKNDSDSVSYINNNESYNTLLHTLEWNDFRNSILKRDNYKCRYCGKNYKLQVHHKYYLKYPDGIYAKPWDYPYNAVITLCDNCHKNWHKTNKNKVYYKKYDNI